MPVHLSHTVRHGTSQRSIFVVASHSDGSPATGLNHRSTGIQAGYVRIGESAVGITLTQGHVGSWTEGGFVEVDEGLLPGVYQLDLPDRVMAEGSTEALVTVRGQEASFEPVDITMVAYDPQDARSLGLVQLDQSTRHDFLRRALPVFTEMELAIARGEAHDLLNSFDEPHDHESEKGS